MQINLPFSISIPIPLTFFGIVLILVTVFLKAKSSSSAQLKTYGQFLSEEQASNFSRRKDPPPEDFLVVDTSLLPVRTYPEEQAYRRVSERQQAAASSAELPMMVLDPGLDNRALKLKYGVANLDTIVTYEENYHRFIHNLLEWATALIALESVDDAATVLEAAIGYQCDRSQAYTLLAELYAARGAYEELRALRERVRVWLPDPAMARALAMIEEQLSTDGQKGAIV